MIASAFSLPKSVRHVTLAGDVTTTADSCRTYNQTGASRRPTAPGLDAAIWNNDHSTKIDLPGGVSDYFYSYMPLDYDGGGDSPGYFGYKVLALSYGGTLQIYGLKGATYSPLPPSSSGTSWARLNKSLVGGQTGKKVELDRVVDWKQGDKVVITTADYLPGHSEEVTLASDAVNNCNGTSSFTTVLSWTSRRPA